ncbi:progestin and adipoQ receptor family member 3-like [Palaemon carinicauda]|uniref:progestin and adipoQ receptor family member 3-like n=1 Tax=Palaemon carinicauda TaxID=392227 RepID=UPI0035B5D753
MSDCISVGTNDILVTDVLWWTNETLNIWSHIAGFLVFLGLFVYDVTVVYHEYLGTEGDAVVASFVLICFMLCMLLSSLYHTLNSISEESCMKWLAYDVFGISASFLAIFLSGIYYAFWCPEVFLPRIIMMYIISGSAAFVYVFKIPERYFPGRFDYIGASHQLWHLIIVVALVYWHQTGLEYAKFRLTFGCNFEY